MIAFTQKDVEKLQKRAQQDPKYIKAIENSTKNVRTKLYIQETARATWRHYFMCPHHSVKLKFNYYDSVHYQCPIDGEIFTGEPYEGAWWDTVLMVNAGASYKLAVGYMSSGRKDFLDTVHQILLGYAKYYPSYEVHGGVPYNKPGKIAAQVLYDASYLNSFARTYDILKDTFSGEEQKFIEKNLLLEGANHLMKYFTPQIHNHEVDICVTLGIIGLILGREDIIDFAINQKYGLKYQLDHGVLEDGFWFEASVGYHLGTTASFLDFEKFARYTPYSLFADEHYRKIIFNMIVYPNKTIQQNNCLPILNDGVAMLAGREALYEYGYSYFHDREILWALKKCTDGTDRSGIESFLYGEDDLPEMPVHEYKNYFATEGSNLAVVYGSDDRYLLFKNLPYGGEHDHYDRLAISFCAFEKNVCADLGTAGGYGAPLHYAYFKNTAAHNTVCINADNMPPANVKVNEYRQVSDEDIYLDAEVDWKKEPELPDSFTIKQWSDESYKDTYMRRIIQWYDKYFIDVFYVNSPNNLKKDYTLHIDGKLKNLPEGAVFADKISDKNPQSFLHDGYKAKMSGIKKISYECDGFDLDIYSLCDNKEMLFLLGPDNPSTRDISYILERTEAKEAVYINVIETHKGDPLIEKVEMSENDGKVSVLITEKSGKKRSFEKQL